MLRELPPTAGLPLRWYDLLPRGDSSTLDAALAEFLGVPAVQIECSGTAGLLIALETLKRLSSRKTVVVPGYTCPLVALAVARAGLRICPCDVRSDSFDFDRQALEACCDRDTLCIVPTHIGGLVADLDPVLEIGRQVGAYVIEDAAQALGATRQGQPAGTIGDIGIFSLTRGKGLTTYEGGVVVARNPDIQEELSKTSQELAPFKPGLELLRTVQLIGYWLAYNPLGLQLVYGMPLRYWLDKGNPVRAVGDEFSPDIPLHKVGVGRKTIAASAFNRLAPAIADNATRGRNRAAQLSALPGLTVLQEQPETSGTWPFLIVLFDSPASRQRALDRLWRSGTGVSRLFIHALTDYDYLEAIVPRVEIPNARAFADKSMTITNSPWLSDNDFAGIVDTIASVIGS